LERVKDIADGLKGQASHNDELCSTKHLKVVYAVQLADKSLLDETASLSSSSPKATHKYQIQ
jgi:hypothetical protein